MFKRKRKYTEKEQEVLEIIKSFCENEKTEVRVNPRNFDILISLEDKHYDIVIDYKSVLIANTNSFVRENFNDRFLDELRSVCFNRAEKDREEVKQNILNREKELLKNIKESLL